MSRTAGSPVRALPFAMLAVTAVLLAGCATPPASDGGPSSTTEPHTGELVTTPGAVTVLDDGTGAELCLGAIATSFPPQCGGPEIIGWDWAEWPDSFETAAGVRWGMFTLTGTYDADAVTFTPAEVRPWREGDQPGGDEWPGAVDFRTPCEAPAGGWQVLDGARTTDESMNSAFERAAQLPGYAASWVDRSRVPSSGADATPEEQLAETAPFPELTIVNVMVVGDVAVAEAALREVWGGMLCVTTAERTAAELQGILQELMPSNGSALDILSAIPNGMTGQVELSVIHDDGALQRSMDEEYGAGVVVVSSVLRPAD